MRNRVRQAIVQVVILLILLGLSAGAEAATLTVINNGDNGAGSLRQAVLDAAATGDTIDFNAGITLITLTSGEIAISKSLTITGPGARSLTISGGGSSRIFNVSSAAVVVEGVTLTNGNANTGTFNGGAVFNSGSLTLNKVAVIGNSAPSTGPPGNGGGIANSGTMILNDVTVAGNSAASSGGGIYNDSNILFINNSTISGNTSVDGGGIYNYSGGSSLTLNNSTITGNTTTSISSAALDNYFGDFLTIDNTILSGNTTNSPADLLAGGTPPTVNSSIIDVLSGSTAAGSVFISAPALLEPLLNNGGPTDTHALLSGSPALNAGNPATCLSKDQRGGHPPSPGQL